MRTWISACKHKILATALIGNKCLFFCVFEHLNSCGSQKQGLPNRLHVQRLVGRESVFSPMVDDMRRAHLDGCTCTLFEERVAHVQIAPIRRVGWLRPRGTVISRCSKANEWSARHPIYGKGTRSHDCEKLVCNELLCSSGFQLFKRSLNRK
jgi:hypothetical protein